MIRYRRNPNCTIGLAKNKISHKYVGTVERMKMKQAKPIDDVLSGTVRKGEVILRLRCV